MARGRLLRIPLEAVSVLLSLGAFASLPLSLRAAETPDAAHPAAPPPPAEAPVDPAPPQAFFHPNSVKMTPEVRERLAQLLQLPKEQLWAQLMEWPAFKEMSLQQQAEFVNRLALMREHIRVQALKKAAELGIAVPPEKEEAFVNSYIQERMAIERKIWQETQAKRRELDEQLQSNLKKQYLGGSSSAPVPTLAPAPAAGSAP